MFFSISIYSSHFHPDPHHSHHDSPHSNLDSRIPTLIPHIPTLTLCIPSIPFPDSPFRFLQIKYIQTVVSFLCVRINLNIISRSVVRNSNKNKLIRCNHVQCFQNQSITKNFVNELMNISVINWKIVQPNPNHMD